jgi:hypothetical protein
MPIRCLNENLISRSLIDDLSLIASYIFVVQGIPSKILNGLFLVGYLPGVVGEPLLPLRTTEH